MQSSNEFDIALIPGDGVGTEVIPEGVRVLEAASNKIRN
jgi:tartrate dehydrogenase/decarboxylase/D-malate dehydrogenase